MGLHRRFLPETAQAGLGRISPGPEPGAQGRQLQIQRELFVAPV